MEKLCYQFCPDDIPIGLKGGRKEFVTSPDIYQVPARVDNDDEEDRGSVGQQWADYGTILWIRGLCDGPCIPWNCGLDGDCKSATGEPQGELMMQHFGRDYIVII